MAMSSGMPAAASDPSVSSNTKNAIITPTDSAAEKPGIAVENASPPYETWVPSGSASVSWVTASCTPSVTTAGTSPVDTFI